MPLSQVFQARFTWVLVAVVVVARAPQAGLPAILAADGPAAGLFGDPTVSLAAPPAGGDAAATAPGEAAQRPDRGHLDLTAAWRPATKEGRGTIAIRLAPDEGWHLYPVSRRDGGGVGQGKPTLVSVPSAEAITVVGVTARAFAADGGAGPAPDTGIAGKEGVRILPGDLELLVDLDRTGAAGGIDLLVGFQTCNDTTCDPPWAARLTAAFEADGKPPRLAFTKARYAEVSQKPVAIGLPAGVEGGAAPPAGQATGSAGGLSLPLALLMGIAGGLILNLMPCVLPVLGLKLMSFAQQSGRARDEVFAMNLWYVAGLYAVFFVLATASVAANLGLGTSNLAWGEQFTSTRFNIVMCSIVFAFALSFLGVWELPIPGFIGEKAGHVQSKEGPLGSFLKGVLSTVLATPCSGPFLGPVFGFTLSQPTIVTYAVFGAIATGMALPYILVGLLPGLVKFLPKPGIWMETLKEILGFVMLGTVVFLFSFLARPWIVPTIGLLFAIWAGCWWIGKAQDSGTIPGPARWLQAGLVAASLGAVSFGLLGPVQSLLPWEPFSRARLAELRERGATVMVDFSANWCMTCKLNLATAIETNKVKRVVDANRVVTLLADWSEESDEIKTMLESLEAKSIPLLAIFPASAIGEPQRNPIILRDLISESQVLEALDEAGPSQLSDSEVRGRTAGR